jgi:hypothetical protein
MALKVKASCCYSYCKEEEEEEEEEEEKAFPMVRELLLVLVRKKDWPLKTTHM